MQQPPTQGPGGAADELRSDAQELTSKAANRIYGEVDARKGNAAEQAKSVSNAIQTAAGQLDESAPTWLKSAFQQGADQIQRLAETIISYRSLSHLYGHANGSGWGTAMDRRYDFIGSGT